MIFVTFVVNISFEESEKHKGIRYLPVMVDALYP
jgi:hypothetical protein